MISEIHPGAFHLKGFLNIDRQKALADRCQKLGESPAGFYTPVVRTGAYMRVRMLCLGKHWNAKTYKYESTRSDFDGLPVQEIPEELKEIARHAAADVEMSVNPDICIINFYNETAKMGLHQDKEESPETIQAGIPIVSISIGDSARFVIGGMTRKDPLRRVLLESGDALVMGGPSRLRFHGVSGIVPATAPPELKLTGRFNLTFRQY
jgi:DNA alkylation damage repair protein AlkB